MDGSLDQRWFEEDDDEEFQLFLRAEKKYASRPTAKVFRVGSKRGDSPCGLSADGKREKDVAHSSLERTVSRKSLSALEHQNPGENSSNKHPVSLFRQRCRLKDWPPPGSEFQRSQRSVPTDAEDTEKDAESCLGPVTELEARSTSEDGENPVVEEVPDVPQDGFPIASRRKEEKPLEEPEAFDSRRPSPKSLPSHIDASISAANERRMLGMSSTQIAEACDEIYEKLSSDTIELILRKIAAKKLEDKPKLRVHISPTHAELCLDHVDAKKLEWSTPLEEIGGDPPREFSGKKVDSAVRTPITRSLASLRFGFNGTVLTTTSFPPQQWEPALHHHGLEPEKPGYTLDEIVNFLLSSTLVGQRRIALSILEGVFSMAHTSQRKSGHTFGFESALWERYMFESLEVHWKVFLSLKTKNETLRAAAWSTLASILAPVRPIPIIYAARKSCDLIALGNVIFPEYLRAARLLSQLADGPSISQLSACARRVLFDEERQAIGRMLQSVGCIDLDESGRCMAGANDGGGAGSSVTPQEASVPEEQKEMNNLTKAQFDIVYHLLCGIPTVPTASVQNPERTSNLMNSDLCDIASYTLAASPANFETASSVLRVMTAVALHSSVAAEKIVTHENWTREFFSLSERLVNPQKTGLENISMRREQLTGSSATTNGPSSRNLMKTDADDNAQIDTFETNTIRSQLRLDILLFLHVILEAVDMEYAVEFLALSDESLSDGSVFIILLRQTFFEVLQGRHASLEQEPSPGGLINGVVFEIAIRVLLDLQKLRVWEERLDYLFEEILVYLTSNDCISCGVLRALLKYLESRVLAEPNYIIYPSNHVVQVARLLSSIYRNVVAVAAAIEKEHLLLSCVPDHGTGATPEDVTSADNRIATLVESTDFLTVFLRVVTTSLELVGKNCCVDKTGNAAQSINSNANVDREIWIRTFVEMMDLASGLQKLLQAKDLLQLIADLPAEGKGNLAEDIGRYLQSGFYSQYYSIPIVPSFTSLATSTARFLLDVIDFNSAVGIAVNKFGGLLSSKEIAALKLELSFQQHANSDRSLDTFGTCAKFCGGFLDEFVALWLQLTKQSSYFEGDLRLCGGYNLRKSCPFFVGLSELLLVVARARSKERTEHEEKHTIQQLLNAVSLAATAKTARSALIALLEHVCPHAEKKIVDGVVQFIISLGRGFFTPPSYCTNLDSWMASCLEDCLLEALPIALQLRCSRPDILEGIFHVAVLLSNIFVRAPAMQLIEIIARICTNSLSERPEIMKATKSEAVLADEDKTVISKVASFYYESLGDPTRPSQELTSSTAKRHVNIIRLERMSDMLVIELKRAEEIDSFYAIGLWALMHPRGGNLTEKIRQSLWSDETALLLLNRHSSLPPPRTPETASSVLLMVKTFIISNPQLHDGPVLEFARKSLCPSQATRLLIDAAES